MTRVWIITGLVTLLWFPATAQQSISTSDTIAGQASTGESPAETAKSKSPYLSVGSDGIAISSHYKDSIRKKKTVTIHWGMLDLGTNGLIDRSDYNTTAAQQFLQVPSKMRNEDLFSLRPAKSINVNIWPLLMQVKLMQHTQQELSFYTGIGLQLYNFRFNKDISFRNDTHPLIINDTIHFSKNKLAFSYASIPLMLNFKTRMSGDLWLTYGFGIIGGYCLNSWTKQVSDERGKQKNHDNFNFQRFNLNLSGEIGISNYIRLYATYQVTNLYQNVLNQHPFAIGIRFLGI